MNLAAPKPDDGQAAAIAALMRAQASSAQQQIAMSWVLNELCGVARPMWMPDNARLSDYQQGMRFVGCALLEIGRLPMPAIEGSE